MDPFSKLPSEIAFKILTRVPGDTVLDCKSVCRKWRTIVGVVSKDPLFIRMHLNHPSAAEDSCKLGFLALTEKDFYYLEYNDDQNHELTMPKRKINSANIGDASCLVGSCNGLTCLAREENERPVCIFNPLTREYVVLPEIRTGLFDEYDENDDWSFGFGFLSATNEYKVVGIYDGSKSNSLEVYVYTIGSGNGWRDLGRNFNLEFSPSHHNKYGSFSNGAIYWIGGVVDKIVTFDLIEEKFCQHLAPPPLPPNRDLVHQTIGVLGRFLYIAIYDNGDELFDIWVLKDKNDNHDKQKGEKQQSLDWSKELRVYEAKLLAVTKNGGVLTYTSSDYYVNLYNPEMLTSEMLVDFKEEILQVFPHKNTFVSLKEIGDRKL